MRTTPDDRRPPTSREAGLQDFTDNMGERAIDWRWRMAGLEPSVWKSVEGRRTLRALTSFGDRIQGGCVLMIRYTILSVLMAAVVLLTIHSAADTILTDPNAHDASSRPTAMRGLPEDLHHWHYYGNPAAESQQPGLTSPHAAVSAPHLALPRRLWDREDLRSAYLSPGLHQLRPFLAKLHAGQSVTVVAFGDSIVEKHGGCFHRNMEHLAQHGVSIPSGVYMRSHCSNDLQV